MDCFMNLSQSNQAFQRGCYWRIEQHKLYWKCEQPHNLWVNAVLREDDVYIEVEFIERVENGHVELYLSIYLSVCLSVCLSL